MPALLRQRRSQIIFGTMFGAWLGLIYAFSSQAVNWIALPGIPLAAPGGGLSSYLFQYSILGAILGFAASVPPATMAGVVVGGVLSALLSAIVAFVSQWGEETAATTFIFIFYTFLPLSVLLMPLAYLIRRGVDAQTVDPDRPYLWARRVLVPAVITLVVVALGSFALYNADVRKAFRYTDRMIAEALAAESQQDLPVSVRSVAGFREKAIPAYEMYWSDRADEFQGPLPASGEMSQFLIFVHFQNNYRIACVFARTTTVPNCTNQ
jgi:hypothetical protein